MHLVIPFAAPLSEAGRQAQRAVERPVLQALMARLAVQERADGDEWSLSPPHERVLARVLGFSGADGRLPWAAWQARRDGLDTTDGAWGLVTPTHWHLGTEQVSLVDPATLMLDDASARALFGAVRELFTSEGYGLHYGAATRWYLVHESLAELATASLDRVIGRNVDRWLGADPALRRVRRLQGEVQMLLHTHPINAEREARGLLPVNSFWLSGCGRDQPAKAGDVRVDERLRAPALAEDWAAWVKAWATLDAGPLAELQAALARGGTPGLTLCGERSAVTLAPGSAPAWRQRFALWRRASPTELLETL
jgi:hypothetical protein